MSEDVGAVFVQQPNVLGAIEDVEALMAVKPEGAVGVGSYDPIPLGILKPPGECGVDVCVGEGQPLGNRLDFGGPSFGFFAATEALPAPHARPHRRRDHDVDGRRGFVLTLQTREQHIRREKATSNICTAQALNALGGVVYLSWLGRQGIVELGELLLAAHATTRASAWSRSTGSSRCTSSRSSASSRCAATRRSTGSSSAAPSRASTRATAARYAGDATACSWRSPSSARGGHRPAVDVSAAGRGAAHADGGEGSAPA